MTYVHGYCDREHTRLNDQAATLVELLHHDTSYPQGARVLEAGCGVGAQTVTLAANSPGAAFTSMDISEKSLAEAQRKLKLANLKNVTFHQGDIFALDFPEDSFDHVFVCFVLEHLPAPVLALENLLRVLKPGGSLTVIEGDHGSTFFHPHSEAAHQAIQCQVELQKRAGGNADIGRQLYPLLSSAGLQDVQVSPRMVYVDASRPAFVEGFTKNTFTAMIEGVRQSSLDAGIIDVETFDQGIRDLYRCAEDDGVFCYTFFKAVGVKA